MPTRLISVLEKLAARAANATIDRFIDISVSGHRLFEKCLCTAVVLGSGSVSLVDLAADLARAAPSLNR
jgi:hypothetical protein